MTTAGVDSGILAVKRHHLTTFRIRRSGDIASTRERTRVAAEALGIYRDDAVRVATAASEVTRALVGKGASGELNLEVLVGRRPGLALRFGTDRELVETSDASWDPIRAARMLMDACEKRQVGHVHELLLVKYMPGPFDPSERIAAAKEALARLESCHEPLTLRDQNREMARLLAELRERGRELERMNDELQRANNSSMARLLEMAELARRKDELAAAIAHDLRSPLAAIKGALDLLGSGAAGALSGAQRRYVEIADRAARHILALVSDLLDSSLIDAGLARLSLETLAIADVAAEVCPTIAFLAREKGIAFETSIPPDLPAVRADRHKVAQILSNLLTNAVKFTEPGGHVELKARPAASSQWVEIQVADTGVGMTPAQVAELWDKYHRSHSRGTRGERGTGLGLYICRQLVELHGGGIVVDSELGRGTTFRLTLPRAAAAEATHGADEAGAT